MSSPTWTPDALWSERRSYRAVCWRLVEAQHHVSTLKLVDSLEEQALLEDIIEETKPRIPAECQHLDYLLATPFRYGAPYPHGSRFRRAGHTPGVYYAAESAQTALAEMVFYRFLFFAESPQTRWPDNAAEYTAIGARIKTPSALDLTTAPLDRDKDAWTHRTDYAACQDLADTARGASLEVIRYMSVRDPGGGANLAVLECKAFEEPRPVARRSWRIRLGPHGAQAVQDHPRQHIEFGRSAFDDPRIATLNWQR